MRQGHTAVAHRACRARTCSGFVCLQRLGRLPQGGKATHHEHVRRRDHRRRGAVRAYRMIDIYLLYSFIQFFAAISSTVDPNLWGSWPPQFDPSHRHRVFPAVAVDHTGLLSRSHCVAGKRPGQHGRNHLSGGHLTTHMRASRQFIEHGGPGTAVQPVLTCSWSALPAIRRRNPWNYERP